jgi:hypothetical protein
MLRHMQCQTSAAAYARLSTLSSLPHIIQVDFAFLKNLTKRARFAYAIIAVAYGSFSLSMYLAGCNSLNLTAAVETSSAMDVRISAHATLFTCALAQPPFHCD